MCILYVMRVLKHARNGNMSCLSFKNVHFVFYDLLLIGFFFYYSWTHRTFPSTKVCSECTSRLLVLFAFIHTTNVLSHTNMIVLSTIV